MGEWITSGVRDGCYIFDDYLKDSRRTILVTYETGGGRRYVKQVECLYGYVHKKLGGDVVAWMPLPEPYKGKVFHKKIYTVCSIV